jgi:chemosensory pili system protein ChpA (sensor histidine kinase/response regulator)
LPLVAVTPAPPIEASPEAQSLPVAAPIPPPVAPQQPVEMRAAERAETARVDAALLDVLLNGAGEINIFQSRLAQQVHSIEFHLGELGSTVARLREQLRKLEAETEAQILHRHQDDVESQMGFDPLELDRYSTIQQLSRGLAETASDVASINELLNGLTNEADTLLTQQARVTSDLQNGLMQTRMVPFHRHVGRLQRIVRQACADTGKMAELVLEGENSEIDRQVLESMLPPFEHLLRNAVAHGIEKPAARGQRGKPESGRVLLKIRREGSEVIVEVADDGGGLDLAAIRRKAQEKGLVGENQKITDEQAVELILQPGFSTASELTQAAGRGVGMDVVDTEVKKLGGSMRIETAAGRGTRFLIRLPYTLAITHALIVNVGEETFALPLPTVEGITRLSRDKILQHLTQDEPKLDYGGIVYRIQHLGSLVGAAPSALPEDESAVSLVLIRAGESSTALLMDSLEGSREIVVKTLGPHIASVPGVTGATILGDGRVIMILDPGTLVRAHRPMDTVLHAAPETAKPSHVTALVVDDSITMRRVTQRLLERRGAKVYTARDGLDAITVLQEHPVDIILLDIEMPRMDGYQLATHVRNDPKLKHLPIVMITSRSGEKHRAKAIEIGVNDYLSKPYQESQLVAAIEALVGRELEQR